MALTATPSSGDAPYVIAWVVENKGSFNTGYFSVSVRSVQTTGSCTASVISGANRPADVAALLANDQFNFITTVPAGSCRNVSVLITDLRSNEVVSQDYVLIDNLE